MSKENIEQRLARIEFLLTISTKSVFDVSEAAQFLGLSEARVYHLTAANGIPHYKKGRSVYFKKSELEEWLLESRVMSESELRSKAAVHSTR